jgi:hypothetical protein
LATELLSHKRHREPEGANHLKIETSFDRAGITLRLIGRIQAQHLPQLEKEIEGSRATRVCLREVTLVDVDVVRFLMACEDRGISVMNCSPYIREWMDRERQQRD